MQHKKSDSKGRLPLGSSFANMDFLVDKKNPNEIIIKIAAIIPQNELWLYKNKTAAHSVKQGISDAKNKKFGKDPLDNKDMSWLDEIED